VPLKLDTQPHSFQVWDPLWGVAPNNCGAGFGLFATLTVYPNSSSFEDIRMIIGRPSAAAISVSDCTALPWAAGTETDFWISYVGYVEPVHHLDPY